MIESSGSSIKTESLQRAGSSSNPRRLLSLWPLTSTVTLSEENGGVRLMMSYGISSISLGIIKKYSTFKFLGILHDLATSKGSNGFI